MQSKSRANNQSTKECGIQRYQAGYLALLLCPRTHQVQQHGALRGWHNRSR